MHFQTATLACAASLASVASAGIVSFTIPKTIVPGGNFSVTVHDSNATKTHDLAVIFGITQGEGSKQALYGAGSDTLGKFFGPDIKLDPTTWDGKLDGLSVPDYYKKGKALVSAVVTSTMGVANYPGLIFLNATVTLGDKVSKETVKSGEALGTEGFCSYY